MTQVEFLKANIEWAKRMLALPQLPGTLTVERVNEVLEESELELIDHAHYTADGRVVYR